VDAVSEPHDTITVRIRHGKTTGYAIGCRCADCKAAHAAYMAAYHQRPEVKAKKAANERRMRRLARLAVEAGLE
jgi:hypothetical protein